MRTEGGVDKRQELIDASISFLDRIKNRTPGDELESYLNAECGPGSEVYDLIAGLAKQGVAEGWAANEEVGGPRYRRSKLVEPKAETFNFSITLVYMDSEEIFRGQYHGHPYGEINLIVPITPGAAASGMNGWCYGGWTSPAPGSHHYPQVRGGAVVQLFYLPAGRISYDIAPPVETAVS